jgi:hypothetical protein
VQENIADVGAEFMNIFALGERIIAIGRYSEFGELTVAFELKSQPH